MKIIEGLFALVGLLAVTDQRRCEPSKGFTQCDSAWQCEKCGALFEDVWDLKPHRLSHLTANMTSILKRLKAWSFPTPEAENVQYLQAHEDMLSEDDRKFVAVMRARLKADLPFHKSHKLRIYELVEDIQSRHAW